MLHLVASIHKAKPSANGPTWWHVPRWRKQEQQSTQRRWLVMCLASPSLTGQHLTGASSHVTGAFLHVMGAFLNVTGAFLHVTGASLHVTGASLHLTGASLHAFLKGLAVHDRLSLNLFVCLSVCLPVHWVMFGIAISGISASLKTDDMSMRLSICLPACLTACLSVCS